MGWAIWMVLVMISCDICDSANNIECVRLHDVDYLRLTKHQSTMALLCLGCKREYLAYVHDKRLDAMDGDTDTEYNSECSGNDIGDF